MRKTENRIVKKLLDERHEAILEIAMTIRCSYERTAIDTQKVLAVLEVAKSINLLTRVVNGQPNRTIAAMQKTWLTETVVKKD